MATNHQIITEEANMIGFEYDGSNLKTFAEWKKVGMSVKKGEKATLKVGLWKPVTVKEKDKKTGEEKEVRQFIKTTCFLFNPEQVQPLKEPKKKKETVKKAEPKETAKPEVKKTATKKAVTKKATTKKTTTKKTTKKEPIVKAEANKIDDETRSVIFAALDELGI